MFIKPITIKRNRPGIKKSSNGAFLSISEAFVPIDETEDEEYGEEEALSTTPFALLQIVQTCLASQNELDNMCRGISATYSHDDVVHVLEELREDIIESIDGNVSC